MVDYKVTNSREGMARFIDYVRKLDSGREVEVEFPYRGEKLCLDIKLVSDTLCIETGRMIAVSCKDPRANPPIIKLKAVMVERPEVESIEDLIRRQSGLAKNIN